MSFYAYEDEARMKEVFAENVTEETKLNEYICPYPNCTGRMYIRSIKGDKKANFASKPNTIHIIGCKIQSYNFNPTEYNEELFDLDDFKTKLLKEVKQNDNNGNSGVYKKGDGNEQPISTVRQLYNMCVNKGINQTYQGNYIRDLLVDDRTRFLYNTYIRGFKLIDCYCYRYDDIKQCYYAKYWKDIEHRRYILIKIHFINNEMFIEQYVRIFRKNIIVAAEWEMINDICVGNIFKNRQILILD